MKKQSAFTLIELMVVMAIIAILATAGLSAYTGYIKKARDATRIADLAAINAIVLASMDATGMPPAPADLSGLIKAANNGQRIIDPLTVLPTNLPTNVSPNCFWPDGSGGYVIGNCEYEYDTCDDGTGYVINAFFESESNTPLYDEGEGYPGSENQYDVGSCRLYQDGDLRILDEET